MSGLACPFLESVPAIAATSACACAIVTPGFSRAMMLKFSSPRRVHRICAERERQKDIHLAMLATVGMISPFSRKSGAEHAYDFELILSVSGSVAQAVQ